MSRELQVHEVRFFDPKPRAIHCLAYESKSRRLAVVRCNDEPEESLPISYFIEIWNLRDRPCFEFKINLTSDWRESVEAICWRHPQRLFVTGIHGHVILIHVESGRILKSAAAVSGPVWALSINNAATVLAAGTEDGYISLFDVKDADTLEYLRALDPKGSRILALSWHPDGSTDLLAASGRGKIWVWDAKRAIIKQELRPNKRGKDDTVVSSVIFLKDGTLVSGDSTGATVFWDINTGTSLMNFTGHGSGVLSLTSLNLPDQTFVYASGIDPTTYEFRSVKSDSRVLNWVQTYARHSHTHDVRAMCSSRQRVVSGGQDSYLMITGVCSDKVSLKIPPNSETAVLHVASSALHPHVPLLCVQNSSSLEVWHLTAVSNGQLPDYSLLLKFTFAKGKEMITASAISEKGDWLAVSSPRGTKAYRLILSGDSQSQMDMNIIPVVTSDKVLPYPACRLLFCGDQLIVADKRSVYVCRLHWKNHNGLQSAVVEKVDDVHFLTIDEQVRLLTSTGSGRFIAFVTSRGDVRVYDRESKCETVSMDVDDDTDTEPVPSPYKVILPPQSNSVITSCSFTENDPPLLLLLYANGIVASFNAATSEYAKVEGITLGNEHMPLTHSSIYKNLAMLHNWKEGCLLERSGTTWTVKKMLQFDEFLIRIMFAPNGDLLNVTQTPTMIQNQLPPMIARKVFGI